MKKRSVLWSTASAWQFFSKKWDFYTIHSKFVQTECWHSESQKLVLNHLCVTHNIRIKRSKLVLCTLYVYLLNYVMKVSILGSQNGSFEPELAICPKMGFWEKQVIMNVTNQNQSPVKSELGHYFIRLAINNLLEYDIIIFYTL